MLQQEKDSDWGSKLQLVEGPTIRESTGLALSSRNQRLSSSEMQVALSLSEALDKANQCAASGEGISSALGEAMKVFSSNPEAKLDYLALVNPESFEALEDGFTGQALMVVAAEVGNVRLIDNRSITF
jgi:pantoate--beta-alanine ligase